MREAGVVFEPRERDNIVYALSRGRSEKERCAGMQSFLARIEPAPALSLSRSAVSIMTREARMGIELKRLVKSGGGVNVAVKEAPNP
jgi:hypothetical protein